MTLKVISRLPKLMRLSSNTSSSRNAKAKENRRQAVQFLKSVTSCTSCGQRGHWNGDDICPNVKKSAKGKRKKKPLAPSSPKKKPATSLFVLHDSLESADEKTQFICFSNQLSVNDIAQNAQISKYDPALTSLFLKLQASQV